MALNQYQRLLQATEAQVGKVTIVLHKDSWLISFIHWFLKLITRRDSFSGFTTTIGRRMYVPNDWHVRNHDDQYILLRHERVHMLQFREWPFRFLGVPYLWTINACIFGFCYLLVLPAWWNPFRTHFERAGYRETIRAHIELGNIDVDNPKHWTRWVEFMEATFTGSAYAWMASAGYATDFVDAIFVEHRKKAEEHG